MQSQSYANLVQIYSKRMPVCEKSEACRGLADRMPRVKRKVGWRCLWEVCLCLCVCVDATRRPNTTKQGTPQATEIWQWLTCKTLFVMHLAQWILLCSSQRLACDCPMRLSVWWFPISKKKENKKAWQPDAACQGRHQALSQLGLLKRTH